MAAQGRPSRHGQRTALEPRNLYVHAPFCARRCGYCDFAVTVAADPPVVAWAEAIGRELAMVADEMGWSAPLAIDTLYLGGGTPSLLGPGAITRLLEALVPHADPGGVVEFTAEANPESFTPDVARDWRSHGVDRVSLGAQTFHEASLRWMGRLHGPDGPARAVSIAREAGFTNVGLDLIFGLPERLDRDLDEDLDRVIELAPHHVSVYGLSVERDTPLGRWVAEGREAVPDQERYRDEYLRVADRLRAEGYAHYEVSNFARPGLESRHNSAYWSGVPYLGLGNGAHSFVDQRRWWNHRDWGEYRTVVAQGGWPRADEEQITSAEHQMERLWLGLRTARGVDRAELSDAASTVVETWTQRGWVVPHAERLILSVEGWLLLDRLTVELDAAQGVGAAVPGGVA